MVFTVASSASQDALSQFASLASNLNSPRRKSLRPGKREQTLFGRLSSVRREAGLPRRPGASCYAGHTVPCRPGRGRVGRHWGERGVVGLQLGGITLEGGVQGRELRHAFLGQGEALRVNIDADRDRKSTRLNSSHLGISYA